MNYDDKGRNTGACRQSDENMIYGFNFRIASILEFTCSFS
jgi:hypothetical protein